MKLKNIKLIVIIAMIIFIIIVAVCFWINQNNKIKVEAASAFYPYTQDLFENTNSSVKFVSTGQAFEDIINGDADIVVATSPSDEQQQQIEDSGVELEFITLYLEPLAILVNSENAIDNLNVSDIQNIYYNTSSNWSDFNGDNLEIHTYQLEKNNGSQTCFESIVKNNILGNNHFEITTMPDIIDKIASDKSSIGYAFYSYFSKMYYNENVKIINVDGKTIFSDEYPLLFEVYLIYRKDNEDIEKYIESLNLFY